MFHFTLAGGLCVQKYQQVLGCNDKIWWKCKVWRCCLEGKMRRKGWGVGRRGKPHVVLRMEAVVLAILLLWCVTWPFAQHTCPREISGSFYGDRVSSTGGRMAARGGGRRDCWSCTVLFLNIAEMRWWLQTQPGPRLLHLTETFKDCRRWAGQVFFFFFKLGTESKSEWAHQKSEINSKPTCFTKWNICRFEWFFFTYSYVGK